MEEFYNYWLNQHGPLIRKHPSILGMNLRVQSHTIQNPMRDAAVSQPRGITDIYDGITVHRKRVIDATAGQTRFSSSFDSNEAVRPKEA